MLLIAISLGLLIGFAFLSLGIWPSTFDLEGQPFLLRMLLLLFGAVMLFSSILATRHAMRARSALRRNQPEPVTAKVEVHEDSESTTHLIVATIAGQTWAVPAYYGKGVARLETGEATDVLAWCDPSTGAPIAFSVDGLPIQTYPNATRR